MSTQQLPPTRRSSRIKRQPIPNISAQELASSHISPPSHLRIARDRLDSMHVPELKQALRDRGLKLTGTKADLQARLLKAQAFVVDSNFALPKRCVLSRSSLPGRLQVYLENLFPLTMRARRLLCIIASNICVNDHIAAMLLMTGPELEGLSRVLAAGILLSRSIPASSDTSTLMAPFLRALAAVSLAAVKGNPLQYIPAPDSTFDEVQWSADVLARDGYKPIIICSKGPYHAISNDTCVEASPFFPLLLTSAGSDSPFWAATFLLFGSSATENLRAHICTTANGMTERSDIKIGWNDGQLRLAYAGHGEAHVDLKLLVDDGSLERELTCHRTFRPERPGAPPLSQEARPIAHGDVYRVSTVDAERWPVPTRLVVEVRSAFQCVWNLTRLFEKSHRAAEGYTYGGKSWADVLYKDDPEWREASMMVP